ncbi:hypothetical protein [Moorena sp. SIO3I6]|uniref:hypothetical protein n=1 Tax=Moorena sp. SIO3I6 TaxID=2607831 RepID=UPI0025FCB8B3|nr:hypothetical protein [Moorena sp. SIO3I6]
MFKVNIKPSTLNLQHQTFNIKPSTSNLQHQTFNIKPSTLNLQHQTYPTPNPYGKQPSC